MKLPLSLSQSTEWTFLGPMGPTPPAHLLSHSTLGVDGGAHFAEALDLWVGDSDSFSGKVPTDNVFYFSPHKAHSDLALALQLLTASLPYKLHLWGFLGGRRDHELFNIGECLNFLEQHPRAQVYLYAEDGRVSFHMVGAGEWVISHQGLFSLGAVKETTIRLHGECDYKLLAPTSLGPLSSLGLSNRSFGEFHLETSGPAFIHYPEEK